jgi:hypothetical protein
MRAFLSAVAILLTGSAHARHWTPRTEWQPEPITVTCDDVRRAVALVGLDAARSQARQLGMTRSQERHAAHCLRSTEQ